MTFRAIASASGSEEVVVFTTSSWMALWTHPLKLGATTVIDRAASTTPQPLLVGTKSDLILKPESLPSG
jgi:hypothetical protein